LEGIKVIMHNAISLDGSILHFEPNLGLFYQIASGFNAEMVLVGSNTARTGIEMFYPEPLQEEASDYIKPLDKSQYCVPWVIPDSKGILQGRLHILRRYEHCRDIVVLLAESTPSSYIKYLEERNYDHFVVGHDNVDLRKGLELMSQRYGVKTITTDAGVTLNCLLLEKGLVDEISLLVSPVIVGNVSVNLFGKLHSPNGGIKLEMIKSEVMENDHLWLMYRVKHELSCISRGISSE
jgi:2,5-diamino-6-(ribosylamino)-4(3H)-pyrimidinone 5'-phosphate reductase